MSTISSKHRVGVVTGSSSDILRAVALQIAREAANIVCADLIPDPIGDILSFVPTGGNQLAELSSASDNYLAALT